MVSDKLIKEYQELARKDGREISLQEATEEANRLAFFFEVIYEISLREAKRTKKLEKEPEGFYLEEDGKQYSCLLCSSPISGKTGWWDKWGQKCLNCQKNIKEGVIPPEVCKDRKIWITNWELKRKFNIHPQTTRKLINEGKLIVRDLKDDNGKIYYSIFLIAENKKFFTALINSSNTNI